MASARLVIFRSPEMSTMSVLQICQHCYSNIILETAQKSNNHKALILHMLIGLDKPY